MSSVLEIAVRFGTDLLERTDGPLMFRFFLQPSMAVVTAAVDGFRDGKIGRAPYLHRLIHSETIARRAVWREGIIATSRILLIGVCMDLIYQYRVFGSLLYPMESFVIAVLLGYIPYLALRGPFARLSGYFLARRRAARRRDTDRDSPS